ncbi:MAG: metallophosphoesterase [Lautropia sp.]
MPTLTLLPFALSAYMALRLLPALAAWPVVQVATGVLLAVTAVAIPATFAEMWRRRPARAPWRHRLHVAGLVLIGLGSSLFVLTVLRDAGLVLLQLAAAVVPDVRAHGGWPAALPGAARLGELSALAVPALAGTASLAGWFGARRIAPVRTVEIPIAGLPAALDGFTIAQISDLHVGDTIRQREVAAIVDRVNALQADLVAITGDLVDGPVATLAPEVAPLARLRSREGTFFVTGNHEYYSGAAPWLAELRRLGMQVLSNRHVVIRRGDAALVLAGVTDWSAQRFDPSSPSDPAAAIRGAPADAAVRVLLAHQPRSAAAAADAGFDLQLSGHTHGGQFLPWTFFVRWQQPYTAGLRRLRSLWVYTSRGTGYWGPPMRFGAPSEITRIRLVAGDNPARPVRPTPVRRVPRS